MILFYVFAPIFKSALIEDNLTPVSVSAFNLLQNVLIKGYKGNPKKGEIQERISN